MNKRYTLIILILSSLILLSTSVFAASNMTTSHVFVLNVNPIVVEVLQSPDPAEVGISYIIIKANVTDNNGVPGDIAIVNATFDFGTPSNPTDDVIVGLVYNATSGLYENDTYQLPNTATIGIWVVNVTAIDNYNAIGYNSTTFTVNDTIYPQVTDLYPVNGTKYNATDTVCIMVNITDNGVISYAYVNVSYDATSEYLGLVYNSTSGFWENCTVNTSYVGVYTVQFYVNDTGNNLNNTEYLYFNITDSYPPYIYYINDYPDPVTPGNIINFTANVTDMGSAVQFVWVEINGVNYTMTPAGGDEYYFQDFDTYIAPGQYTYTVYANDTAGNMALANSSTFNVNTLVSLDLLNDPIDFGNTTVPVTNRQADAGGSPGVNGYIGSTVKGFPLIVNNTGNVNQNMSILGTNLIGQSDPSYVVEVGNITYNLTPTLPGIPLTTTDTLFKANLAMATTQDLYFWISLPAGLISQDYMGNVTITAIQS